MKKTLILLFLGLISTYALKAQTNANHPSIQTVTVSYKAATQNLAGIGQGIQAFPNVKVILNSTANVATIYFKISNAATNAVIYQSSYTTASASVINNGVTLFDNSNGMITLGYNQAVVVKPYKYELWTADAQQNASPVFLLTR